MKLSIIALIITFVEFLFNKLYTNFKQIFNQKLQKFKQNQI